MGSRGRKAAAGVALAAAVAMAPGSAWADGTQTPPGAPRITVGVPTFGSLASPDSSPRQDYFRLPNLLAQDRVTVAVLPDQPIYVCLAGDVDEFNWSQQRCNLSEDEYVGTSGARHTLVASRATNAAYLRMFRDFNRQGYQFTVEKIQHRLALRISAGAEIDTKGRLSVQTFLTNGRGVVDGHLLSIDVVVDGRRYNYRARTSGGKAVFQLNLPDSAANKSATITASSSSSSANYTGASTSRGIRIVK